MFSYTTNDVQTKTKTERILVQKVAGVKYNVMSFGALLQCVVYDPAERLAYTQMVSGCSGGAALLYVSFDTIKLWCALGILWLIRDVVVNLGSTFVVLRQLTKND